MSNPIALIIEDDGMLSEMYSHALSRAKFESIVVNNGGQALTTIKDTLPNLVILDMNLPEIPGNVIYEAICSDVRYDTVPIIIATANHTLANSLKPLIRSTDFIMQKPFHIATLVEIARKIATKNEV